MRPWLGHNNMDPPSTRLLMLVAMCCQIATSGSSKLNATLASSSRFDGSNKGKTRRSPTPAVQLPAQYDAYTTSRDLNNVRLRTRICGPVCGGLNTECRSNCSQELLAVGAQVGVLDSTNAINKLYDSINELRYRLLAAYGGIAAPRYERAVRRMERERSWGGKWRARRGVVATPMSTILAFTP